MKLPLTIILQLYYNKVLLIYYHSKTMNDKTARLKTFDEKACTTCILNKLNRLSQTEQERIDAQVMARATHYFEAPRFVSKYQRVTLVQQFVLFLLVMLSAFILAILIGGTAGVVQRVIKARPTQAPTPNYKLIQQK